VGNSKRKVATVRSTKAIKYNSEYGEEERIITIRMTRKKWMTISLRREETRG
jgi:hypothetical protein